MLRVLGITGTGPKKENRIIFYSFLFVLVATLLYILSFYTAPEQKRFEKEEGPESEKGNYEGRLSDAISSFRKVSYRSWQKA